MEQVVDAVMQNPAYAEGGLEFRHGELLEMLRLDAGGFVRRFGKYMGMVQMRAVEEEFGKNEDVRVELKRAKRAVTTGDEVSDVVVSNRRLRYFETVLCGEDNPYMSEVEMRRRDPAGWDYFVGRGRDVPLPSDDDGDYGNGLGGFFIRALQRQELRFVEAAQKGADQAMESLMTGESLSTQRIDPEEDAMDQGSDEDENLLDLWKRSHKAKFIRGEDEFFDYSLVDGHDEYDDMKQIAADEEEKWFDGDDDE